MDAAALNLPALREHVEALRLRHEARLLSSLVNQPLAEAWGDLVDTREYLRDDPTFRGDMLLSPYYTSIDDRTNGRYLPVYESEQDLARIRAAVRRLEMVTPIVYGAGDSLANYVLGPGFKFAVTPEDETDEYSTSVAAAAQKIVDRFIDDSDFCGIIDREMDRRARQDGESFVHLIVADGKVCVEFIEPDQVVEPANTRDLESWLGTQEPSCWRFGVHTPEGRTSRVLGYHVVYDGVGLNWDYVPADRMEHLKRNVSRNAKRGVSDFFPLCRDLEREAKLRGNMAEGAALQAAIAWILQTPSGTTQSQAQALNTTGAIAMYNRKTYSGTTQQAVKHYPAGTVLTPSPGLEYQPGPMGAERNGGFELVGQYVLRAIGTRWNMPEYMVSGDASNANYSSSLVAESPFVKAREADQQFYRRHFLSLIWKVLRIHVESGRLQKNGIGPGQYAVLESLIRIDADAPLVASRDPNAASAADKFLRDEGVLSDVTLAARWGLDLQKEQAAGAEKAEPPPQLAPFANAMQPGVLPPELAQANADKAQERADQAAAAAGSSPTAAMQAAVESALESAYCDDEAKAILRRLVETAACG